MKLTKSRAWVLAALVGATVTLNSCGGDDPVAVPEPDAQFSFTVEGKTVTFADESSNAESYLWDFADGETSTEASPSHEYSGNGVYAVKLTVTNASGNDESNQVVSVVSITIDGDFSDWDGVEAISADVTGSTVSTIKIENLGNITLFIYVEGSDAFTSLTQLALNIDNDTTTGANITWRYPRAGDDVLIEGALAGGDDQFASIYACEPCDGSMPGEWNYAGTPFNADPTSFLLASAMTDVANGKAYEFSIDLTALGSTVNSEAIGIGFQDMSPDTWDVAGSIPALFNEEDNPLATLYLYTFK